MVFLPSTLAWRFSNKPVSEEEVRGAVKELTLLLVWDEEVYQKVYERYLELVIKKPNDDRRE